MAMRIIIDGYNLIGMQKGLHGDIERRREELIRQLQQYRRRRGYAVTVVFDGWRSGNAWEREEDRGGVTVVFTRDGERADEVIGRMAERWREGAIVVSSDREVMNQARRAGAVALRSGEFEPKLRESQADGMEDKDEGSAEYFPSTTEKRGNPRRLSKADRRKRRRLQKL
jgi:predicted RNA-binding protein with PIN domain